MLDLRDHFAVPPAPAVELRAFTHGLMPRTVPALMQGFCEDWATRGVDAWNRVPDRWALGHDTSWWALPEDLGDAYLAPLLGAPAGTCVLQPNVHWSVSALLSCDAPFGNGRTEVVLTDAEFPSVRHAVKRWAGLRDIRPVEVPAGAGGFVDVDAVLEAITDRTAWVFVSHVGFATGEVLADDTLRAIADRAHAHGAHVCIDGYHATASVPIHAAALGVDAYVGGLLKEASGSTGNSYLYVGSDLRPRLAGWFADADPFGFRPEPADNPVPRRRFLAGTTAVASTYHAVEGLRVLFAARDGERSGVDAVRADTLAKGALAVAHAERLGLALRSPAEPARRGAMLVFGVAHADRLSAWLKAQGVYTDSRRGEVLRMAPFVWNTETDIAHAFDAVGHALETGEHLAYTPPAEGGPVT
ncbi:MAG TPA: aminotransferase class V-fold PLP-dependent enzyme [Rubricoccaceae bacterium]|jgi:kynureninase